LGPAEALPDQFLGKTPASIAAAGVKIVGPSHPLCNTSVGKCCAYAGVGKQLFFINSVRV
jgi:hypothetical protein